MPKVRGNPKPVALDKSVPRSKCRKWELRVSVGRDLATGKYPPMTRRFNGTLSEANQAMRDFIAEIEMGAVKRRAGMDLGCYSSAWIMECKEKYAYNTWTKYENQLKCINRLIGKATLDEIDAYLLESVYARLLAGETPSGKPASGTYVRDIAATLHLMFKSAVKDKHMPNNPCDYAEAPGRDTKERKTIRSGAIVKLLDKLDPRDPVQFALRAMIKNGIRREEAVALDVIDADFAHAIIHIRHGSDALGKKETKTPAGERDLPITESFRNDLRVRIAQIEEDFREIREDIGMPYPVLTDDTPLVCNKLGERLKPDAPTHWWRANRERLGYPDITPHDLRHSYLSELARRKVEPKVLQKIAGHADYRTTMGIYVHVDLEDMQEALEVVDW